MTIEQQVLFLHCASLVLKWPEYAQNPTELITAWTSGGAHSTVKDFVEHEACRDMMRSITEGYNEQDLRTSEERIAAHLLLCQDKAQSIPSDFALAYLRSHADL